MILIFIATGILLMSTLCTRISAKNVVKSSNDLKELVDDDSLANFYMSKDGQNSLINMELDNQKDEPLKTIQNSNDTLNPILPYFELRSSLNESGRRKEMNDFLDRDRGSRFSGLSPSRLPASNDVQKMHLSNCEFIKDVQHESTTQRFLSTRFYRAENAPQHKLNFVMKMPKSKKPNNKRKIIRLVVDDREHPRISGPSGLHRKTFQNELNPKELRIWHMRRNLLEEEQPTGMIKFSPKSFDYNGQLIYRKVKGISRRLNTIHKERMTLKKVTRKTEKGLKKLDLIIQACQVKTRLLEHQLSDSKLRLQGLLDITRQKDALDDAVSKNLVGISYFISKQLYDADTSQNYVK